MTSEVPKQPAIVTIGNFDGVHLGHQKLLHQVAERARSLGLCSMAITFSPHPEQVLFPERPVTHLSSPEERRELMQASGIDDVWICPFTTDLSRLEPAEFMRMVADRQPLAELWVGAEFALGQGRRGTIQVLSDLGSALDWAVHVVPPYRLEGQVVSSTAIRTLLGAGAVRGAADLLGRPYSVVGQVVGSDLEVDPLRALPRQGTYEAQLHVAGETNDTIASIGPAPGHLHLHSAPPADGAATLTFLRRAD